MGPSLLYATQRSHDTEEMEEHGEGRRRMLWSQCEISPRTHNAQAPCLSVSLRVLRVVKAAA